MKRAETEPKDIAQFHVLQYTWHESMAYIVKLTGTESLQRYLRYYLHYVVLSFGIIEIIDREKSITI